MPTPTPTLSSSLPSLSARHIGEDLQDKFDVFFRAGLGDAQQMSEAGSETGTGVGTGAGTANSRSQKLIEIPYYRELNLTANGIFLRLRSQELPHHVRDVEEMVRRDRSTQDTVLSDSCLEQLQLGTTEEAVDFCFKKHLLADPLLTDALMVSYKQQMSINSTAFSLASNGTEARLYILQDDQLYYSKTIDTFLLQDPLHYRRLRTHLLNILERGRDQRLTEIRSALDIVVDGKKQVSAAARPGEHVDHAMPPPPPTRRRKDNSEAASARKRPRPRQFSRVGSRDSNNGSSSNNSSARLGAGDEQELE